MPPKPPAEECGRLGPFTKEPATRCDEDGRTEPAMFKALLDERDP